MVLPAGLAPATTSFAGWCSIYLSYGSKDGQGVNRMLAAGLNGLSCFRRYSTMLRSLRLMVEDNPELSAHQIGWGRRLRRPRKLCPRVVEETNYQFATN